MTDTDYDSFMDAVSSEFEQHLQWLFPDDYGLQRIAWDAWDDFRRTKTQSEPHAVGVEDRIRLDTMTDVRLEEVHLAVLKERRRRMGIKD